MLLMYFNISYSYGFPLVAGDCMIVLDHDNISYLHASDALYHQELRFMTDILTDCPFYALTDLRWLAG